MSVQARSQGRPKEAGLSYKDCEFNLWLLNLINNNVFATGLLSGSANKSPSRTGRGNTDAMEPTVLAKPLKDVVEPLEQVNSPIPTSVAVS